MRRRFSGFFVLVSLSLSASISFAGFPSLIDSTYPRHIMLVGTDASGVADPAGTITCVARHAGGGNYGNPLFVLDLSQTPDVELCTSQPDPAVIVDCPTRTARWFGDIHGAASVRIAGHANHAAAGANEPTAKLFCDGVLFVTLPVATPDEDGNGIGAADNSLYQRDYWSGQYWPRSDFTGEGLMTAGDLSVWLGIYFAGGSTRNCTTSVCP